jgi:hypothetical protein
MSFDTPSSKRRIDELERQLNICEKCHEKLSDKVENKVPFLIKDCQHIICRQCRESALSSQTVGPKLCPVESCLSVVSDAYQIFVQLVQTEEVNELRAAQESELASAKEKRSQTGNILGSPWIQADPTIVQELCFTTPEFHGMFRSINGTARTTCLDVDNCIGGGYVVALGCNTAKTSEKFCGKIELHENGKFKSKFSTPHKNTLLDIKFNTVDNRILAIGSKDGSFSIVDSRGDRDGHKTTLRPCQPVGSVCWDINSPNNFLCATNTGCVLLFDIRNVTDPLVECDIVISNPRLRECHGQNDEHFRFSKVNCFWGKDENVFHASEYTPNYLFSNQFGVSLFSVDPTDNQDLMLFDDCGVSRRSLTANYKSKPGFGPIGYTAFDVNTKTLVLFERVYQYDRVFKQANFPSCYRNKEQHRELNFLKYPCWNINVAQEMSAAEKHLWIPKSNLSVSFDQDGMLSTTFDEFFNTPLSCYKEIDFVQHHSSKIHPLCLILAYPSVLHVYDVVNEKPLVHFDFSKTNLSPITGVTGFFDQNKQASMAFVLHIDGFSTSILSEEEPN